MRRRNEFTKAILKALQTPNRTISGASPTLGNTKIARNAIFRSVAQVLTASGSLTGEFDRLNEVTVGMRDTETENVAQAWAEDVEKTARLLKIGAELAIRNVKKVLGVGMNGEGVEDMREESTTMEAIDRMELNYELQRSLRFAERGVRKMVKSLLPKAPARTATTLLWLALWEACLLPASRLSSLSSPCESLKGLATSLYLRFTIRGSTIIDHDTTASTTRWFI